MKILIANDGYHAHYFERLAWANAFNSVSNIEAQLYDVNNSRAFDVFDRYEPDIYIGQLYNLSPATIKCISSRPNLKAALRAGEWTDAVSDPHILEVTPNEIDNLRLLLNSTGKPDFIYTHYQQKDIEQTHHKFTDLGVKLVGMPMCADVNTYLNSRFREDLECDIGFVGGYWPYKGLVIDEYLTPLCQNFDYKIKIFGNQPWPHVNQYCGIINDYMAACLFRSAKICPNLSEPHAQVRGIDVNERAFKILCAGGFCIMDNVRAAKELFPVGVVFAYDHEHFRELVDYYLDPKNLDEKNSIASLGRLHVLQNHSNFHRISLFLHEFGEYKQAELINRAYNDYIYNLQQGQTVTA